MKHCIVCNKEIPKGRLKAIPQATKCVNCVYAEGDVPRIKRHDDSARDGEIQVSTYYTQNSEFGRPVGNISMVPQLDPNYWPENYKTFAVYNGLSTAFEGE